MEKALGPAPLKLGVADPKTRYYPVCVIMPNFVAVGQAVTAEVVGPSVTFAVSRPVKKR